MKPEDADLLTKFKQVEQSIGINPTNFTKRFVYTPISYPEAYLARRDESTPSQLAGIDVQLEKRIGQLMSEFIFKAGESLQVPVSTAIVAICISRFYFARKSYIQADFRDVCMGAMFLACKLEQTMRKSYQVAAVFDYIFKIFEGQNYSLRVIVLNSTQYEYMKSRVLVSEKNILFELGFEVYRLLEIPHREIGIFLKSFDRHKRSLEISQLSWTILNDAYKTSVCLYYPGQIIAAAAVYLALSKLSIPQPPCPWWVLLEASYDSIQSIVCEVESLYENMRQPLTIGGISIQLSQIGEQRHKLVNVFPVPYYRKITLDAENMLRMPIIQQPPQSILGISERPQRQQSHGRDRSAKNKKHKSERKNKEKRKKHKDEKHKKKHKHSREREKKSESSSHSDNSLVASEKLEGIADDQVKNTEERITHTEECKQRVKEMQIGSAKGLISEISLQLQNRDLRRKKEAQLEEEEENQMMAALIQKKKEKTALKDLGVS